MQIEEGFRDLKSQRTGFALTRYRCRCPKRMSNLLLIALIATWVVCLVGHFTERQRQHYAFQANTVRHKRVLSWFFIGICVLNRPHFLNKTIPWESTKLIIQHRINQHSLFEI